MNIARIRLAAQHIAGNGFTTAKDLVSWMGALQAQDFNMMKWAVGIRLPGSTEKSVDGAINDGSVIRTHLMRPTWHLVSADDIRWMLELTAPQIKRSMFARHRDLEITENVVKKTRALLEKNLSGGNHLTRDELVKEFENAGMATGDNRAAHLLLSAELDGLICSGASRGKLPTYALLDERVPSSKPFNRAEALGWLTMRYFLSHGPATLPDFIWWSGLPAGDARKALEMIKPGLVSETYGEDVYWMAESTAAAGKSDPIMNFLPAYDEFIISYRDRSAALSEKHIAKAVSSNGIFRPVIVVDGQVTGLWKRTFKNNRLTVETEFFIKQGKSASTRIEKAVLAYADFLELTSYGISNTNQT